MGFIILNHNRDPKPVRIGPYPRFQGLYSDILYFQHPNTTKPMKINSIHQPQRVPFYITQFCFFFERLFYCDL